VKLYVLAAVCVICAGCDLDDWPGTDWMSRDKIVQRLQGLGYTNITELEADDGHWEGKGLKNGRVMEFHADPHTGIVIREKQDD
jgi:hypothetical protein